jgi:hypothetical protein
MPDTALLDAIGMRVVAGVIARLVRVFMVPALVGGIAMYRGMIERARSFAVSVVVGVVFGGPSSCCGRIGGHRDGQAGAERGRAGDPCG